MERTWLIILRLKAGYKQYELAEMVGINNNTLSNIEKGKRMPSGHVAYKLSQILGFDMKRFYEEESA